MQTKKPIWIPQVITSILLLIALYPENPYGYYVILRWIVCAIFAFLALQAYEQESKEWVWVLGITAAIYNPFIRIHIGREVWNIVNIITIIVALVSIVKLKKYR